MTPSAELPVAPAAERNFEPILGVLCDEFRGSGRVLEIGSGTGQHAAGFAAELDWLRWQPSDVAARLPDINRWVMASGCSNLLTPIELDVSRAPETGQRYDAAFSANTAHIMPQRSVEDMFDLVGAVLVARGRFCLYGPFSEAGRFSTQSNAQFDATLRRSDPDMGIRDLEFIDTSAGRASLLRARTHAMPGNNLLLVFEKAGEEGE